MFEIVFVLNWIIFNKGRFILLQFPLFCCLILQTKSAPWCLLFLVKYLVEFQVINILIYNIVMVP